MNDRQVLARTIKNIAIYYGRPIEAEVLSMMCDDLADLPVDKVVSGYAQYRRNPKNRTFPLPSQIRELVNPDEYVSAETLARETAARIVGAVSTYGWANAKAAELYIGPEGWGVVKRNGGWSHLCEMLNSGNEVAFKAQFRDQLEGVFRYGVDTIEKSIDALPDADARRGKLTSFKDVLKLIGQKPNPDLTPAG